MHDARGSYRYEYVEDRIVPLARAGGLLGLIFVIGTIGYWILGTEDQGLLDAVYMTTITLTTVGYHEVIELEHSTGGKLFTTLLLIFGVGSLAYLFSNVTAFMVEGGLAAVLRRRRARRRLHDLSGHYVVAGCGETGEHVVDELVRAGHTVVAIDVDPTRFRGLSKKVIALRGDAGDDAVLERARVDLATGLSACVGTDRDNLIVVVSARRLAPQLRIAARCSEVRTESKLRAAGADTVISPNAIAAHRIVSSVTRPHSLAFLKALSHADPSENVLLDASVHDGSVFAGRTLGDLREAIGARLLVLAVHDSGEGWTFGPGDHEPLHAGRAIVLIGTRALAAELEALGLR